MPEKGSQKKDDENDDGSKRLTREEYDRLVQGVDDIFFGGMDEPEGEKKTPVEKPASEPPKCEGDEA